MKTDASILTRINMDCAPGGIELLTPGGGLRWGNCRFDEIGRAHV